MRSRPAPLLRFAPAAALAATGVLVLAGCAAGGGGRDGTNNREVRAAAEAAEVTVPGTVVAYGEPAVLALGDDGTGRFELVLEAPQAADPAWYDGQSIVEDHLATGGSMLTVRYTITALDEAAASTDSSVRVSPTDAEGAAVGSGYSHNAFGVDECLAHDGASPLAVGESASGCLSLIFDGAEGELPERLGARGGGDFAIYDFVYWDAGAE